jgi:hypothetical protein
MLRAPSGARWPWRCCFPRACGDDRNRRPRELTAPPGVSQVMVRRVLAPLLLTLLLGARQHAAQTAPLLSRRSQALSPTSFVLTVGRGGALSLDLGNITFEVTSRWSEVGPHWNNLTVGLPYGGSSNGWAGGDPTVDASSSAQGRWVVTAKAFNFTLSRVIQVDPPPTSAARANDTQFSARRLLINDTITNTAPATIGMAIRHSAALVEGGTVDGVTVPGVLSPSSCGTDQNPSNFCPAVGSCDRDAHRMNGASPHVFFNATASSSTFHVAAASLGLVALDDVFRVHAETRNMAVRQLSHRVPSHCDVSSPPSIELEDPILAIGLGTSRTHEWAIYPASSRAGRTDFFDFVNVLRNDYGTDRMQIGAYAGVLSAMEHGSDAAYQDMSEWSQSGYQAPTCNNSVPPRERMGCTNWTDWPKEDILK